MVFAVVTLPLPLRIIGGTEKDIPEYQRKTLPQRRDPVPKNGSLKPMQAWFESLDQRIGILSFGLNIAQVDRVGDRR